jgi:hypothetical protein
VSYALSVSLLRPVLVNELFSSTQAALADLTGLRDGLEIRWEYPPNSKVRAALTDSLSEGVSFYVTLASVADGSLVQFGVIDPKWRVDDPADAYFSVHSFPPANVLALAMAIAAGRLAGSKIEDSSSHWLGQRRATSLKTCSRNLDSQSHPVI